MIAQRQFTLFQTATLLLQLSILLSSTTVLLVNAQTLSPTVPSIGNTSPSSSPSGPASSPSQAISTPTSSTPVVSQQQPSPSSNPPVQTTSTANDNVVSSKATPKSSTTSSSVTPATTSTNDFLASASSTPSTRSSSSVSSHTSSSSVVEVSRTGIIASNDAPFSGLSNPTASSTDSSDNSEATSPAAAGKPTSFLENKGASAATFTVVGLIGAAGIIFIVSFILRKRRQNAQLDDDHFDTEMGSRFRGPHRETYATSSFGMGAVVEKYASNTENDVTRDQSFLDQSHVEDAETMLGHQAVQHNPFDPYENNYTLPQSGPPAAGFSSSLVPDEYRLTLLEQAQQQQRAPQHLHPYSTQNHTAFNDVYGGYTANTQVQQNYGVQQSYGQQQGHGQQQGYEQQGYNSTTAHNDTDPIDYLGHPAYDEQAYSPQESKSLASLPSHYTQFSFEDPYLHSGQHAVLEREPSTRSMPGTQWGVAC